MKSRLTKIGAVLLALLLSGCGGGGGGGSSTVSPLFVSVTYSGAGIKLFNASTVTPTFSGFQGHTPVCVLTSGNVPPGMTFNSNCTISGVPTNVGTYTFSIRISASDAAGTTNGSGSVRVDGPSGLYGLTVTDPHVGTFESRSPAMNGWTPPSSGATWVYAVTTGALPPGLTLNTVTGEIAGTYTTAGSFNAGITGTVTTVYGSYITYGNFFRMVLP